MSSNYDPRDYAKEYMKGELTLRMLWEAGFRPVSSKYHVIKKSWKAYGKYYSSEITLDSIDYDSFLDIPSEIEQEDEDEQDRKDWERIQYLQDKFGGTL
jgi:cytochrome oxidase Cu insertion factor (SCO1/SenC/PrrC family)